MYFEPGNILNIINTTKTIGEVMKNWILEEKRKHNQ
jgi:hypothetical protein